MSCPYSEEELAIWDGVTNPMDDVCYTCTEFECEHNSNYDENPDIYDENEFIEEMRTWMKELGINFDDIWEN